jgi:hypothetical protein
MQKKLSKTPRATSAKEARRIVKTTIQLTVLHPADTSLDGQDILEIVHEMDTGEYLGTWQITNTRSVSPSSVAKECRAVGNDGTFFDLE